MPTRRRGAPKKHVSSSASTTAAAAAAAPSGPLFTSAVLPGTLITLRFTWAAAQHAALARMEAFYEGAASSGDGEAGAYLTLQEAKEARLCRNYEAFNLPLEAARSWLGKMREKEEDANPASTQAAATSSEEAAEESEVWWAPYCNVEERQLLAQLDALGALEASPLSTAPRYLISILTTKPSSQTHELQHALFFLSASFRAASEAAFAALAGRARKAVEHDLGMRGYAARVWPDEFQAYVHEDVGEFGNVAREACVEAREALKGVRERAMREEGLMGQ